MWLSDCIIIGGNFCPWGNQAWQKVKINETTLVVHCEEVEGISSQIWCSHFPYVHTKVWDYVNQFAEFNNYINSPVANYKEKL